MKVLLVEDDPYFAQIVSEYLTDNGLFVHVVKSTQEALSIRLEEYNVAIIDIMLPNDTDLSGISSEEARGGYLAGIALTRRFRKQIPHFPVILFSQEIFGGEAKQWAKENGIPFVFKYEDRSRLLSTLSKLGIVQTTEYPRAFIVHGHDEALLLELKDYLQNILKWPEPIILREHAHAGRTIIEKFEEYAKGLDWVFVLISPDDKAFDPKSNDEKRRARQNVIFELGFFYGLLGRFEGRVLVLKKGEVELPTDIQGIAWINVDNGIKKSSEDIRREIVSKSK
ncbi:MAG: nucleotide-binding protein [Syntrophobacterales bacterium]|jgi:CheY-like chemotaxis protein|nr:nucleotide-binding protein [Syntrophobacterales bacterium]